MTLGRGADLTVRLRDRKYSITFSGQSCFDTIVIRGTLLSLTRSDCPKHLHSENCIHYFTSVIIKLLFRINKFRSYALPRVIIFSTTTIDGRIASKTRFSQLSCPHDLRRLHELRAQCDAVMVGANTVIIDDPSLRLKYVEGKNPDRIVVDGLLKTPLNARVYDLRIARTIVLTTRAAPAEKIEKLKFMGVKVLCLADNPPIDMKVAMKALDEEGYKTVLVEGGGELLWHLFKDRVANELRVTIAPYIFGGKDSVSLVMGEGFSTTAESPIFKLKSIERCMCEDEVHIVYDVRYRS